MSKSPALKAFWYLPGDFDQVLIGKKGAVINLSQSLGRMSPLSSLWFLDIIIDDMEGMMTSSLNLGSS